MSVFKIITRKCLNVLMAILFSTGILFAQSTTTREYQVKAVFIFNFTQFVEWPANSFSSADAPFIIGILGDDPFGSSLKEAVSGEKMNGHPIIAQHITNFAEIPSCHILFISQSERNNMEQIAANMEGRSILTIGDGLDFLKQGGIIRFLARNNKIQFQINLVSSKTAHLVISSKLLRLAEIYDPLK